jgi:DNA (cytosine-5)-methyltransferase 1
MTFTFVDLFAGIGGFRLALDSLGGACLFANDNDVYCRIQYDYNFGRENFLRADIRSVDTKFIPDHDILTAGFPCPAFSIGGV